ncbi:MAG: hypothetical protein ACR2QJ_11365 [Geminicoccaceae bacterium]
MGVAAGMNQFTAAATDWAIGHTRHFGYFIDIIAPKGEDGRAFGTMNAIG